MSNKHPVLIQPVSYSASEKTELLSLNPKMADEKIEIFVVAKSRLQILGVVHQIHLIGQFMNLIRRAIVLPLTFLLVSLSIVTIFFDSETFAEKNEAGQAFTIGATNFPFYTIFLLNRVRIFDLFDKIETKINERELIVL